MKAVLGMLFILVGITTGWLVLSGKLPNATATATTASSSTDSAAAPTDAQINNRYRNQASQPFTPVLKGLPTRIS